MASVTLDTYSGSTSTTGTNAIWDHWVDVCTTSLHTIDSTYADIAWGNWNDTYTSTATTSTNDEFVWYEWVQDAGVYQPAGRGRVHATPVAHQGRIIRPSVNQPERYRKLEEERKKAALKARDLLMDLIGEDQMKLYEETGRLYVKGNKFDYVVRRRGGVEKIAKDKVSDLCVHLSNKYKFPDEDNVVALKMMLEGDEDEILRLANESYIRDRPSALGRAACMN